MSLVPCPSCLRHVRISEPRCPFCANPITEDLSSQVVPNTSLRLSRAALFAFTTLAAGCHTSTENPSPQPPPVAPLPTTPPVAQQPVPQQPPQPVLPQPSPGPIDPGAVATRYGAPARPLPPVRPTHPTPPVRQPPDDPGAYSTRYGAPPAPEEV